MGLIFILFITSQPSFAGNRGYLPPRKKVGLSKQQIAWDEERKKLLEVLPLYLGEEDIIKVNVLLHPELSGEFTIGYNGTITLPLTGEEVTVAGCTKDQIRDILKKKLSEYIEEPVVTVEVVYYGSKQVMILGEVPQPGMYPLGGKSVGYGLSGVYSFRGSIRTLKDLLIAAGIPTKRAALRRVLVITPSYIGKPKVKRVDVFRMLYQGYYRDNIVLNPGDIVYVPTTIPAYIGDQIGNFLGPILGAVGTTRSAVTSAAAVGAGE